MACASWGRMCCYQCSAELQVGSRLPTAVPPACQMVPVAVHQAVPAIGMDHGSWRTWYRGPYTHDGSSLSIKQPDVISEAITAASRRSLRPQKPIFHPILMSRPVHVGAHLQRSHATNDATLLRLDCTTVGHRQHIYERRSTRRSPALVSVLHDAPPLYSQQPCLLRMYSRDQEAPRYEEAQVRLVGVSSWHA